MKKLSLTLISGIILLSSITAQAGSAVCAGITSHYSHYRADYGTPPPFGTEIGEEFLTVNGVIKEKQVFYAGKPNSHWNLFLEYQDKKIIQKTGNSTFGSLTYTARLIATKRVDQEMVTLVDEAVTCRDLWAFVP